MLIRQTLLYLPAQFLAPVAQFLSMMIWTWWLAPEQMAAFVLVTATQELAYLFGRSWFSFYTLRFLPPPEDVEGRHRYLETEPTMLLVLTLPELVAAALSIGFFRGSGDPLDLMGVIALYYVARGLGNHFSERARAQNDILAYSVLQISGTLGGLVAGLFAVEFVAPTAAALIVAYGLAQVLGIVLALPMIGMSFRLRRPDTAILRRALTDGGPVLIISIFSWLAENNIRYVVDQIGGPAAFGLMAVGWGLGRRAASVASQLVTTAAFPIAARLMNEGDRAGAMRQLTVNSALLTAVLMPAMIGLALVGGLFTDLTVAETYREITRQILAFTAVGAMLRFYHLHITDQMLLLDRFYHLIFAINAFEAVAMAVGAVVGYYSDGIVGVVVGALFASVLTFGLSIYLSVSRSGMRFPLVDTAKITLATTAMAMAVLAVCAPPTVAGLALKVGTGALVYVLVLSLVYISDLRPIVSEATPPLS